MVQEERILFSVTQLLKSS